VLLQGARQTGKSTIVKALATQKTKVRYITLDDVEYFPKLDSVKGLDKPTLVKLVTAGGFPEVYLNDSGIAAHLKRVNDLSLDSRPEEIGLLVENFVFTELIKQMTWSTEDIQLSHFRTSKGIEVDFILENTDRKIVGIEVKSATTIRASDIAGMNYLASNFSKQFHKGFILYCGDKTIPLAKGIWCLPISA